MPPFNQQDVRTAIARWRAWAAECRAIAMHMAECDCEDCVADACEASFRSDKATLNAAMLEKLLV